MCVRMMVDSRYHEEHIPFPLVSSPGVYAGCAYVRKSHGFVLFACKVQYGAQDHEFERT